MSYVSVFGILLPNPNFFITIWFLYLLFYVFFFFSSRRRHTRCLSDWSSDVCSSDLRPRVRPPVISHRAGDEDPAAVDHGAGVSSERLPGRSARDEFSRAHAETSASRSEERREGKSGDLGGRSTTKKKKERQEKNEQS